MKAKFLMLASFILMFFVSCDSSSIDESEPADATSSAQAKTAVERDISNSVVATDTPTGSTFVGTMTHLGNIHGVVTATGFLDNGDGTFNFSSNDLLIAANWMNYTHKQMLF